jgi:hypothetical protein
MSYQFPTDLSDEAVRHLQHTLDTLVSTLPCAYLSLVTPTKILFQGCSGVFDPLTNDKAAAQDDVMWFASTTKLITAIGE